MASQNERQRWERWYDQVTERMERQKQSLVRLVAINTEAMAALEEIAAMDGSAPDGQTTPQEYAQERAQLALTRIKSSAAPKEVESVESIEEATPIEDPRRKH